MRRREIDDFIEKTIKQLDVTYIGDTSGENYLGIAHIPIVFRSKKTNIRLIKKVLRVAKINKIRTIILPPYVFNGPLVELLSINEKHRISRYAVSTNSRVYEQIKEYAFENNVAIILSSAYEKSGSHIYISSIAINNFGLLRGKYRKIILSNKEQSYGISPGKIDSKLEVFQIRGNAYAPILYEELIKPDIARIYRFLNTQLYYTPLKPDKDLDIIINYAKIRAKENSTPIILCGSPIYHEGRIIATTPSLIIDYNGRVIYEKRTIEPEILVLDLDTLVDSEREIKGITDKMLVRLWLSNINRIIRRKTHVHKYEEV